MLLFSAGSANSVLWPGAHLAHLNSRYPGPVTQLHPQHKRLLNQKQRAFPRWVYRRVKDRTEVSHLYPTFSYEQKSWGLGSVLQPDDGQGEGVDHQAADDPAAERAPLPWGLLLPGGTLLLLRLHMQTSTAAKCHPWLVVPWNISGVLSANRGQDGWRGAGHQGQEGAT